MNCQHPCDLYIPSGPDAWEDMTRDVNCLFAAIGDAAGETCSCAKFKNILTPWGMRYIIWPLTIASVSSLKPKSAIAWPSAASSAHTSRSPGRVDLGQRSIRPPAFIVHSWAGVAGLIAAGCVPTLQVLVCGLFQENLVFRWSNELIISDGMA